jgi:hypothetical protein
VFLESQQKLYWISKCGKKIIFKDSNSEIMSGIKYFLDKNEVYVAINQQLINQSINQFRNNYFK